MTSLKDKLTEAQKRVVLLMPAPCDADPVRWIAARPYGSLWRKLTKQRDQLVELDRAARALERAAAAGLGILALPQRIAA